MSRVQKNPNTPKRVLWTCKIDNVCMQQTNCSTGHGRCAMPCATNVSELILQRIILKQEVLLQAVTPATVLVIVHDVVVKVHVRALLVVVVCAFGLLVSLQRLWEA